MSQLIMKQIKCIKNKEKWKRKIGENVNKNYSMRNNTIGISFSNGQVGLMVGVQVKSYVDSLVLGPDIWFKVYPLRLLTKTKRGPDFTVAINCGDKVRYGIGLSIPLGIYR